MVPCLIIIYIVLCITLHIIDRFKYVNVLFNIISLSIAFAFGVVDPEATTVLYLAIIIRLMLSFSVKLICK